MAKPVARYTVGDTGLALEVQVMRSGSAVDISTAVTKEIHLRGPDKVVRELTGSFTTDGSDGKVRFVTLSTTLNIAGPWEIWAYIELPSQTWNTTKQEFVVDSV